MTHITVAIPTYNTPAPLLVRAVETVVANSDTLAVVVNDAGHTPWAHLTHLDPQRVARVDLPTNRGSYWARQAVLTATRTEWFATVDADDWIDPTMYQRLLTAATGHDGAMCGRTTHQRGTTTITMPKPTNGPLGRHVASHCSAIWNTRFAQRIGGYSPDRRLGDDSRFVHGAVTAGNITYVNEALYHYVRRPNSLTMARATRPNTVARKRSGAQRRQLQAIMDTTPPDTWHTLTAPTDQVGFAADVQRVQAALP